VRVRDLWTIIDGEVVWNLLWRRQPFLWERDLIGTLLALIGNVNLGVEEDRWLWMPEEGGTFTVKSSYRVLEERQSFNKG